MNAISVHNLGKKFKLFTSPGGRLMEYVTFGKANRHIDFWALKDISFEIPSGTTLGILGQNGSGKSTLLSILAGVLEPSMGGYEINGKVSAILELGSGFHPDFSGRDNVYMYGSIMGLSKRDIDDKFSEIVQFSELGDFIDQPIRTYSSGMVVRLAFSVAVNVNADILIVDEALAVGDAIFQHRCFRKIREMQAAGLTILYVGHDTEAVRSLCNQALLLDGGRIIERGDPHTVVNKYYALINDRESTYNEGNLIEHGVVPGAEYENKFDFIGNFLKAKVESIDGAPVKPQIVTIKSVPRWTIFAHPPSSITYPVSIEPGESLSFAIGILPGAWEKIPQGVKFDIDVISQSGNENIFSRVLQPGRNIGDRGWHNFIVNLEKFYGKNVYLKFKTSGSGNDLSYCWSAWGWMKIVRMKQAISETASCNREGEGFSGMRYGNKRGEITLVELLDKNYNASRIFNSGDLTHVRIHVLLHEDISENLTIACTFKNKFCDVYGTNTKWLGLDLSSRTKNNPFIVEFSQRMIINRGTYSLNAGLVIARTDTEIEVLDRWRDCVIFTVEKRENILGIADLGSSVQEVDDNSQNPI